jgi:FKBP-type peptidyl-prolyl cis-trans isomerase SlyD
MKIEKNSVVSMHYTLKDDNATVLDSSDGRDPLVFIQGHGNLIPGLEAELEGKAAEDVLDVSIAPELGYGVRHEGLVQVLPKEQFAGVPELKPGMQFQANTEQGPIMITIIEVKEDGVVVDGNHPLAGVTLNFHVEIVSVRAATESEIEHGHVHGAGGHQH